MNPLLVSSRGALLLCVAGCLSSPTPSTTEIESPRGLDRNPPLADADVLLGNRQHPSLIERLPLAFEATGTLNTDLLPLMSPVKSQGKRGVCSIFSTVGLMEHLYIKEGTWQSPDFSEQYLQWSAKFEVGSFTSTSGSNSFFNLQAIKNFGVVEESVWPYEIHQWNVDNDPGCTGEDDQPTFCYTNGFPPATALLPQKFFLPAHKALNPFDIKAHILTKGTAVVIGFDVFFQAWNHKLATLPTNEEAWAQGIVVYPNQEDIDASLEDRAGHSIVILGWDDDMEAPMRDKDGAIVLDVMGNPVMEKGFYLFKNSWGTTSFGVDNSLGAGFGWISQRYVHDFADVRTASMPKNVIAPPPPVVEPVPDPVPLPDVPVPDPVPVPEPAPLPLPDPV